MHRTDVIAGKRRTAIVIATALGLTGGPLAAGMATRARAAVAEDPAVVGAFAAPFEEPTGHACDKAQDPAPKCKPAAVALAVLPTGTALYWDGLEGSNRVKHSTVLEYGNVAQNDQSRVLDLSGSQPTWTIPHPEDGGANPHGNPDAQYLPGVPHNNDNVGNDGDLFCAALVHMSDGTVLAAGGSAWYQEPGVPGVPYGGSEVEGLRATRVYDPAANTWRATAPMHHARWYPSLLTLPDGKLLVSGGSANSSSRSTPAIPRTRAATSGRPKPTIRAAGRGPITAPARRGPCRCSPACTSCRTGTCITTPAAKSSTPPARRTTRPSGTSPASTTLSTRRGGISGSP